MAYRSENNPELKSINLSLKLLAGTATSPSPYFRKSISSLQELSNRLNIANQNYNYGRTEREAAKEWYMQKGVNLSSVQEIAREVRKRQKVQQVSKVQSTSWEKLQFEGFDELSIEDFLHKNEERVALTAVMSSFSTNTSSNHMNKLRNNYLASLSGKKAENSVTTKGQPLEPDAKQVVAQFIKNYRNSINQVGPFEVPIHKVIEESLNLQKSSWLRVLYHQIEMIEYLGRQQANKRNYILIISLKELQKTNHKRQLQLNNYTNQFWKSTYDQYRKGKTNFQSTSNELDNELLDNLITIQQQIDQFQDISLESTADISKNDTPLLRRLKLIALGEYEENLINSEPLDDSWLLILTLGLKRHHQDEIEQKKLFKKQVKSFSHRYRHFNISKKQSLEELLTSLVSIGAYSQILEKYKELSDNSALSPYSRAIFVQLFIILALNPELMEQFSSNPLVNGLSRETRSIIEEMVVQIAYFAESFKQANNNYSIFITLIASILANLEKISGKEFQQLTHKINKALRINVNDLFINDCDFLSIITADSNLVKQMLENVILNAKVQSDDDYLNLAELCKKFNIVDLIEHIFLRYLILNQIDTQGKDSAEGLYHSFTPKKDQHEVFEEILSQLQGNISHENAHVLHFLTAIIELKQLVKLRKIDELSAKRKGFEIHMEDERLLRLLGKLCEKEDTKLMDIYVNYYEQLRLMYKLIFLSKNHVVQLRKKYSELVSQLEAVQKRFPALKTQRLGKFIAELYQ